MHISAMRFFLQIRVVLTSLFFLCAQPLWGYFLEGQSWTLDRTVAMQLSLGGPQALSDGFGSFNESAQDALNIWNSHLVHLQFTAVLSSPVVPVQNDDEMSAFFSSTVFGDNFGSGTLAVTLLSFRGSVMEETDTVFNNGVTWDSYRGILRPGVLDFLRVAIHEFGHTLGLDHPDQHGQHVADDAAGATIFLASRAGAFVTGAVIPVDGGLSTVA